mmetsp:Transcript_72106/g.146247  ORF Transcript_72106/g.146247 Transcript_72106/m.146247 type:complete len:127 (-) Transcript_72106:1082-1462(-)
MLVTNTRWGFHYFLTVFDGEKEVVIMTDIPAIQFFIPEITNILIIERFPVCKIKGLQKKNYHYCRNLVQLMEQSYSWWDIQISLGDSEPRGTCYHFIAGCFRLLDHRFPSWSDWLRTSYECALEKL